MTTGAHFNPPTWKLEAKSKINTEHTQKKKSDHETKKKKMLSKSEKMKQINPNNWPQYNTKQKAIAASKLDSIKDKIQRQPNGRDPIEFSWKTDRNASWNRLDMNHETSFRFVGNATANWFNLSVKSTTSWQYSSCSPVPGGGGGGGGGRRGGEHTQTHRKKKREASRGDGENGEDGEDEEDGEGEDGGGL